MVAFGRDLRLCCIDRVYAVELLPPEKQIVVVIHVHFVVHLPGGEEGLRIPEGYLDRLLELHAVRQETVARVREGDVDHAGVETVKVRLGEGDDGDLGLAVNGAFGDVEGHAFILDLLGLAGGDLFAELLALTHRGLA